MSSGAIQFRGATAVIDAYELNNVPSWALFVGREILGQYRGENAQEGAELLGQWCEKLAVGLSEATYQLRMYDPMPRIINNTTPYNYSFKFKLLDVEAGERRQGEYYLALQQRIEALEKERQLLLDREDEDDREDEMGGIQGVIGNILKKPEVQNFLMQSVGRLVAKWAGVNPVPASMAGTPGPAPQEGTVDMSQVYANLPADQQSYLNKALEVLLVNDPKAGERLYKIAMILQNDPGKYNMLAGML